MIGSERLHRTTTPTAVPKELRFDEDAIVNIVSHEKRRTGEAAIHDDSSTVTRQTGGRRRR